MNAYFKKEFSYDALRLEHPTPKDFYVSCWQKGTSPLPLLILRTVLFLSVVTIWISSFITFEVNKMMWFIYLTHWGLTLLLISTFASAGVSAMAYFRRLPDGSLGLSWHEKTYWVLYNAAVPVAFLITVFYWAVIYANDEPLEDEESNMWLDVAIHGLNSAVMLVELLTAAHPSRLLHVFQPLILSVAYMIFGLIYHFAGGVNRRGEPWVYSVIYWANPGTTLLYVLATGVLLLLLHMLVVGLSLARDLLARKLVKQYLPPMFSTNTTHQWNPQNTNVT